MIAKLSRKWSEFKVGAMASVVLCGIVLGAVIAMCTNKPPKVGSPHVLSSFGRVETVCQPVKPAAYSAPSIESVKIAQATIPISGSVPFHQTAPNAYSVLVPDWDGTTYRLKTVVNQ